MVFMDFIAFSGSLVCPGRRNLKNQKVERTFRFSLRMFENSGGKYTTLYNNEMPFPFLLKRFNFKTRLI